MAFLNTLSAVRTAVRSELNESAEGFWLDSELNRWINQVYFRVFRERRRDATQNITLVNGTATYALPSDYKRGSTRVVIFDGITRLLPTRIEDLAAAGRRLTDTGSALTHYYLEGDTIGFIPVPDATAAAKALVHYYERMAAELTADGSPVDLPEDEREAVVLGVLAIAYRKNRRDLNAADGYDVLYQRELFRIRQNHAMDQVNDEWPGTKDVLWPPERPRVFNPLDL